MDGSSGVCLQWIVILSLVFSVGFTSPLDSESDGHVFKVVVSDHSASKRSCRDFPDVLRLDISAPAPFPQSLALYRKDVINTEVPVYLLKSDNQGVVFTEMVENYGEKTVAYENTQSGASFLAKCDSGYSFTVAGTVYVEGHKYRVRHRSEVTTSLEVMTSFYEFAYVNETFHHDDSLQERLRRPLQDNPGLDLSSDRSRSARAKRDTKADYYIDVAVMLDYAFYRYWLERSGNDSAKAVRKAKEYIAYIFNDINTRYNAIEHPDWRLHVLLSAVLIAESPDSSSWTEDVKNVTDSGQVEVNAAEVLSRLKTYVRDNYQKLPKHDHLMLFTEYDLFGEDNGFRFNNTAGYAYIGTTCLTDGESVSVVEDHGGFQSETTATHELGHSLGASHDGDGNDCASSDRYVMSGGVHPVTEANKLNPWHFSSCSSKAFDDHLKNQLQQGLSACLTEQVTPDDVPTVNIYPGEFVGPDEQCRQIYGPNSYLCRGTKFGAPEDICLSMFCKNPATQSTCTLNTAAPGTCCGNQKWCVEGRCVDAPNSTCYTSVTCPFGQRQGPVHDGKSCDQLESANCYSTNFRLICCETCDKQRRNVSGCEYGDKVLQCDAANCRQTLPDTQELYDVQCCGTCSHDPGDLTPTTLTPGGGGGDEVSTTLLPELPGEVDICRDTHLLNGKQCRVFLELSGSGPCCNSSIADYCCHSCQDISNLRNDPACPYGDCQNCANLLAQSVTPCTANARLHCCQTCQELDHKFNVTDITTTSSPTSIITTITNPTDTTRKEGEETEEEDCEFLLGVRTCGASSIFLGGWKMMGGVGMGASMMVAMVVVVVVMVVERVLVFGS